jgi:hypothetical protein
LFGVNPSGFCLVCPAKLALYILAIILRWSDVHVHMYMCEVTRAEGNARRKFEKLRLVSVAFTVVCFVVSRRNRVFKRKGCFSVGASQREFLVNARSEVRCDNVGLQAAVYSTWNVSFPFVTRFVYLSASALLQR